MQYLPLNLVFIIIYTGKLTESLWAVRLVRPWQIFLLDFTNLNFSTKFSNLKSITVTSTTFALFQDEMDSETFLINMNSLHTSLKFTSEKEVNQSLPFLDVLVTKSTNNFTTSIYRKATFTGEYIRWNSFGPKTRKTNLIATLTHCAFKICSKSSLQQELDTIRSLFLENGYPESVISARISKKILQFQKHPIKGPQRCPVYLKLPWINGPDGRYFLAAWVVSKSVHGCLNDRPKPNLPKRKGNLPIYPFRCSVWVC